MTEKEKTAAEALYDLGVAMRELYDQFTHEQRFIFWILDTAERFADWARGRS